MRTRASQDASPRWSIRIRARPRPDKPSRRADGYSARWNAAPRRCRARCPGPRVRTGQARPRSRGVPYMLHAPRKREMRTRRRRRCKWKGAPAAPPSLNHAARALRLELDFPKCRLILIDVLLQNVEQSFRLLRAEIDALKVGNRNAIGRVLIDGAEHQKKVPQVHPDLHAIRIAFAIVGGLGQLDLGLTLRGSHKTPLSRHRRR